MKLKARTTHTWCLPPLPQSAHTVLHPGRQPLLRRRGGSPVSLGPLLGERVPRPCDWRPHGVCRRPLRAFGEHSGLRSLGGFPRGGLLVCRPLAQQCLVSGGRAFEGGGWRWYLGYGGGGMPGVIQAGGGLLCRCKSLMCRAVV